MKNPTSRDKKPTTSEPTTDSLVPDENSDRSTASSDPDALTVSQRRLFNEALRRAEETRDVMEDALVHFGRWVLVNVFDDDASAALDERSDNPVWMSLLARAGGPTLRLSDRMLYVAVHIAARDKRITDSAWRSLEPGRKELLLSLGDEATMRKAAQHVQAMKLSQRATRAYVGALRKEMGRDRKTRLTGARFATQMKRLGAGVATAPFLRQATKAAGELSDAERARVRRDVEALQKWSTEMLKVLRRAG